MPGSCPVQGPGPVLLTWPPGWGRETLPWQLSSAGEAMQERKPTVNTVAIGDVAADATARNTEVPDKGSMSLEKGWRGAG